MGGQACVFYGAAEFSRDTDLAILADAGNLSRLRSRPDGSGGRGHCRAAVRGSSICGGATPFTSAAVILRRLRMRVDVMSQMRGVAPFPDLWARRTTLDLARTGRAAISCPCPTWSGQEDAARQGLADDPPPRRGQLLPSIARTRRRLTSDSGSGSCARPSCWSRSPGPTEPDAFGSSDNDRSSKTRLPDESRLSNER